MRECHLLHSESCLCCLPRVIQYNDNVVGSGNNYDEAYFELKYVRAYTTAVPGATGVAALGTGTHSGGNKSFRLRWSAVSIALASMVLGMGMILW